MPASMRRLALILGLILTTHAVAAPLQIRVATFNASLNRNSLGQLANDLLTVNNNQARRVAEIVQRVRPDILLVNEFDYDAANPTLALTRFHNNYLAVPQNGQTALSYPYRYIAPSNTGVPSGFDLDNNGTVGGTVGSQNYGNDSFGFGLFPGQYSFAVYSKYPLQTAALRSFQTFLWKDMPGAVYPPGYYTTAELNIFRLSSKNHVDLPIEVKPGHVIHLLASHPTPPSFDGAEDRNGRRNHDEIRLWADYISGKTYLRDDAGVFGGLADAQRFVILGDLNADPLDGDSYLSAVNQLRNHPLVNSAPNPSSLGAAGAPQTGVNASHIGDDAFDTSFFSTSSAGNLRVDHVLPSKLGFAVTGSGVFWPASTDPAYGVLFLDATQTQGNQTTDHRLVWLDLAVVPILTQAVRNLTATPQSADVIVTWGTQAGVTYRLETSPDLVMWSGNHGLSIVFDTLAQTATVTDPGAAANPPKYYRLVCTIEP